MTRQTILSSIVRHIQRERLLRIDTADEQTLDALAAAIERDLLLQELTERGYLKRPEDTP